MIIKKKRVTKTSPNKKEVVEKEEVESKSPLFRKKEIKESIKKEAKHFGDNFLESAKALVTPDLSFRNFSIIGSMVAAKTLESAAIKGVDPTEKTPIDKTVNVTKKIVTAPVKVVAAPVKMIKNRRQDF